MNWDLLNEEYVNDARSRRRGRPQLRREVLIAAVTIFLMSIVFFLVFTAFYHPHPLFH